MSGLKGLGQLVEKDSSLSLIPESLCVLDVLVCGAVRVQRHTHAGAHDINRDASVLFHTMSLSHTKDHHTQTTTDRPCEER